MSDRRILAALLALFVALVFFERPGSRLIEPDEARYAEIPREMLARRNFVTPELNGAHYFEKPPLLYWANAASIALLGKTAFAARLPTRLAALGTAAVLIVGLRDGVLLEWGMWAALIFLSAPLSWVLARFNLTDGVLTFGMTLAFFALRRFLLRREEGQNATGSLVVLGVGVALATLAKGLIGIVFPGLVFLLWIAIAGRWRRLRELLLSPAPIIFLAIAAPWFVLVQRANPDFAKIFFIREHFARFATHEAARTGPIYYFVLAFIAGFLPWTFVFWRGLEPLAATRARIAARFPSLALRDGLFFALWFFVILIFFSLSDSKLLPYILPAFPAAAALTARGILADGANFRNPLIAHAILVTALVAAGLAFGIQRGELARYDLTTLALAAGVLLAAGAWIGVALAGRAGRRALFAPALGWGALYLALALASPNVANDLSTHDLAVAAGRAAIHDRAQIVAYRCYPQSFPWTLGHPIAVAAYVEELGSDGVRPANLYWLRAEFWNRWNSGEPMVVVARRRTLHEFDGNALPLDTIAANRRYVVVTNHRRAVPASVATR